MRRKYLIFILIFFFLKISFSQNSLYTTIAIPRFKVNGFDSSFAWLGENMAEGLMGQFVNNRFIRPVERQYLNKILEELSLSLSGIIDEETAARVGKLLGAKEFIFGSLNKYGTKINAKARVVNVERGEILGVADIDVSLDNLFNIPNLIARELSSILATEATVSNIKITNQIKIDFSIYKILNEINEIYKIIPKVGLDINREKNYSKYYFALNLANKIIEVSPTLYIAYQRRAVFNLQLGELQKAYEDLMIAQSFNSNDPDVIFSLGNYYFITKDYNSALRKWEQYVKANSDDSWGWFALAKLYFKNNYLKKSAEYYLKSVLKYPFILEAENNFKTIIRSDNKQSILNYLNSKSNELYNLALLYIAYWNKNQKELEYLLKNSNYQFPNHYLTHFCIGIIEKNKGNYIQALKHFRKCLSLYPEFPDVHREIGLVSIKLGDTINGKSHLRIYLATASYIDDYPKIKKFLLK